MKARNILITLLIILLISFAFFNSSSVNTIDDLAYVVAIGFDVGENYALKVSFQINMPSVSKSSKLIINDFCKTEIIAFNFEFSFCNS